MRKIYALLLGAALTLNGCAWFHKHPVIPAVVTCSGETIPIALVTRVYDDVMTENWIDLAENVVPLLKDGYADLQCVWNYLGTSNPETSPHINAMRAKHADAFRGSTASLDSTKTRGVRPALPGADGTTEATASIGAREPAGTPVGPDATSLRAGPTAGRQAHNLDNRVQLTGPQLSGDFQMPTEEAIPARAGVSGDGFPLAVDPGEGRTVSARAETSPGLRPGPKFVDAVTGPGDSASPGKLARTYQQCDARCGSGNGLVTPTGCKCHVGLGLKAHWIAAR